MTGTIVQYLLYILCWVTLLLATGGLYLAVRANRGLDISVIAWLGGLSMIAGSAPYIGLFGTVWHIIQALGGIGDGNLNVAAIAKPIGQALFTTLWGLGCAIPAVIVHRLIILIAPNSALVRKD